MEFLALHFETATAQPDSPCELGIAVVRGGVVREVRNWLIKPKQWPNFSPWNIAVHGIRPADVAEAPRWIGSGDEVVELLEGSTIVAHNAAFDMSVLRSTLAAHGIAHPTFQYFCSVGMSRKMWPGRSSYGLKPMCDMHGIPLKHHRAGKMQRQPPNWCYVPRNGTTLVRYHPVPSGFQGEDRCVLSRWASDSGREGDCGTCVLLTKRLPTTSS